MFKLPAISVLICGCIFWGLVQACEMQDAKPAKLGVNKGFKGYCPGGLRVTCIYDEDDGWNCDGPEGSYSGAPTMQVALAPACGCG